jgi:rubrerythrin
MLTNLVGWAQVPSQILADVQSLAAAEAQTSQIYRRYAVQAEADQSPAVARLFRAAALAEGFHAENFRRSLVALGGTPVEPPEEAVPVNTTRENLAAAIQREQFELDGRAKNIRDQIPLPPNFSPGSIAENQHMALFRDALANMNQPSTAEYYVCTQCGYIDTQPRDCPGCHAPASTVRRVE